MSTAAARVAARAKWAPFGLATNAKLNEDATAVEYSAELQLGDLDQWLKEARAETVSLVQAAENQSVNNPVLHRLRQKVQEQKSAEAAEEKKKRDAEAAAAAAASATSKDAASKPKTWAEMREEKKAGGAIGVPRGGRVEGPAAPSGSRRTPSGNLIDPKVVRVRNLINVSKAELVRLFGEENGLGKIVRVFTPRDSSAGLAYITYEKESDAAKAIAKMHRQAFKSVILDVDFGTVREKK
jgi:hypothetical protein